MPTILRFDGLRFAQLLETGGRVRGIVSTDGTRLTSDDVVMCAGAWTPMLASGLGLPLSISLVVPQMQATVALPRVLDVVLLGFSRRLSKRSCGCPSNRRTLPFGFAPTGSSWCVS